MRIFKNTWFAHFAQKNQIDDETLKTVVKEVENDQFEADLGGGVYKKRLGRPGGGKSGGYRFIIFLRKMERSFFVFAYPKSSKDNIKPSELADFKKLAKQLLSMTDEQLKLNLELGKYQEITRKEHD